MKNKKIWLGILVIVLVFGMMVIGCDNGNENGNSGSGGSNVDSALNGTWTSTNTINGNEYPGFELQINNGNWESKYYGSLNSKGTLNNGIATITHIHGNACTRYYSTSSFESKWYSKEELQTILNSNVETDFKSINYSVDGNTLTWGGVLYTRK